MAAVNASQIAECAPACVHGTCVTANIPVPPADTVAGPYCDCFAFWSNPTCTEAFPDRVHPWWQVFIAITAVLQSTVVIFGIFNIVHRQVASSRIESISRSPTAIAAAAARKWRGSYRDIIQLLTMTGSMLRCLWLVDPENFKGVYSTAVSWGLLMRGPQIFWSLALGFIILMWNKVLRSIYDDKRRNLCVNATVTCTAAGMLLFAVPASILYALDVWRPVLKWVGNGVVSILCVVELGVGTRLFLQVYNILRERVTLRATITADQYAVFYRAMQVTFTVQVSALAFAFFMVAAVVASYVINISPNATPGFFMAFLYCVHVVGEPGVAWTFMYASYQRPTLSWYQLLCGTSELDAPLHPMGQGYMTGRDQHHVGHLASPSPRRRVGGGTSPYPAVAGVERSTSSPLNPRKARLRPRDATGSLTRHASAARPCGDAASDDGTGYRADASPPGHLSAPLLSQPASTARDVDVSDTMVTESEYVPATSASSVNDSRAHRTV